MAEACGISQAIIIIPSWYIVMGKRGLLWIYILSIASAAVDWYLCIRKTKEALNPTKKMYFFSLLFLCIIIDK